VVLGGTYRIVRRIGKGGMGEVYEARHARLAGRYAVKILHADVRKHPAAVARFQREAQITSALRHPGIVQVIDFNTAPNGLPFLVMELLDGTDLGRVIACDGPLPAARVADITTQLASALTAAHRKGVVHRDLKPQNVFVLPPDGDEPERVKILDFGVSKIRSVTMKITGASAVIGTPQYMAPEQAEGRADAVNAAADQFSLAAIVYEMLAGKPPFAGDSLAAIAYRIVHESPAPLTSFRPDLPNEVQHVVARGLSKNSDERFGSASDFAIALRLSIERRARSGAEDAKTIVSPSAYLQHAAARAAVPDDPSAHDDFLDPATTTSERHSGELSRLRRVATSRRGLVALGAAATAGLSALFLGLALSSHPARPRPAAQRLRQPAGPTVQPLPPRPPPAPEAKLPEEAPRPHVRLKKMEIVAPLPAASEPRAPEPPESGGALEDPFAPSESGRCSITVGSTPAAQLWIDHLDTGRYTPVIDLAVPCGEHQLELKQPDLGIDKAVSISVAPGQAFRQRYRLRVEQ
jgi:serine/threonine-protein kinase